MIQVARDGKIIFHLESEDEFWAKVTSGEILPTDHCWSPSHVTWKLVSQVRPEGSADLQGAAPARTVQEELELIQVRINQLVQAPPLRRPEACVHCGDTHLKTAQLVYEQGTRVGMGYDFGDNDVTVYGSKNLQSAGISPPSEPGDATFALGSGCLMILLSLLVFLVANGMMVMALVDPRKLEQSEAAPDTLLRIVIPALSVLLAVGFFLWLRRYYLPIRMRRRADKLLAQAHVYNNWKNTWICSACGRVTLRSNKG